MSIATTEAQTFYEKFNRHPVLKARMEALLALVEDAGDDIVKAAEAEQRVMEELRQMGNEVLNDWASHRVAKTQTPKGRKGEAKYVASGKKNSVGTRPLAK